MVQIRLKWLNFLLKSTFVFLQKKLSIEIWKNGNFQKTDLKLIKIWNTYLEKTIELGSAKAFF